MMKKWAVLGVLAALAPSYAADRTISANYTLSADETVDGILTVASGVTVNLNGYNLTVQGLAGDGTVTAGAADLTSPDPNGEHVSYTAGAGGFYGGTTAANLFNDNYERKVDAENRIIITKANLPLAVTYDFGADSPKKVDMYKFYVGPLEGNYKRGPKTWTFEGSNDKETWTTLDSHDSVTWPRTQETRAYTFENASAYRYYRITFTAATANDYLELVQLEYFDSADDIAATSELCVNVPANASTTNSMVAITGKIRLVKDGSGEFVAAKKSQKYLCGNRIEAGTLKAEPGVPWLFGEHGTDMTVETGATFDVNGSFYCSHYRCMMNGGTVVNTGEPIDLTHAHLGDMTLTADTSLDSTHALGFYKASALPLCIDLGGHVLDVTNGDGFRLMNATVSNGTLRVSNADGQNRTVFFNSDVTHADTATFDLQGNIGAYYDVEVSNLLLRAGSQTQVNSAATGAYKVYGTFKTETTDFPFVRMMDGSTLDLTAWQGTFDTASTSSNANGYKLTFDTGATVTVDAGGRTFANAECIVAWDEMPQNVTFQFDATTASGGVAPVVTERGIFYGYLADAVEWAWWTGDANDGNLTNPANWLCKNAVGDMVSGGLPADTTRVYLEGSLNIQVPPTASLTCGICILTNCTLAEDCDVRGIGDKLQVAEDAVIDLNGHRLRIYSTALTGNCTVKGHDIGHADDLTDTVASRVSSPTTFYIDGMTAANLFNNNYARSTKGNNKRVIVEEAKLPMVATYDFGEGNAKIVDAYRMWTGPSWSRRLPRIWKFEGSNDNASWTLLDARHAEAEWTDDNRYRTYSFTNTAAYRYYRITIEAAQTNAGGYLELVQLEFFHLKPTQGELHIDSTPGGSTKLNLPGLTLGGNMRVFVEGSGTVRFTKPEQTYVGGTEVVGGTLLPGSGTNSVHCVTLLGEQGSEVVLRGNGSGTASASNSLLDFGARMGYSGYKYVLAGGTFGNPNENLTELRLDADSCLKVTTSFAAGGTGWLGSTGTVNTGYADLGGHTLSVTVGGSRKFGLSNATLENGKLDIVSGGWFTTTNSVVATNNFSLKVHCAPDIGGTFAVRDYYQTNTSKDYNMGDHDVDVYGTFKTGSDGVFHGTTLHDGATIDLCDLTGPLNVLAPFNTNKATAKGVRTLHFEPGATLGVKLDGRQVPVDEPVISWTAADKPDDTVVFISADRGSKLGFIARDDGLYVVPAGFMMIFR